MARHWGLAGFTALAGTRTMTIENEVWDADDDRPRGRAARLAIVGIVMLVLGLVATAGIKSAGDLRAARNQERALVARIAEARLHIRDLEARVARLDDDPATLERLAREQLGMVRPGDVVIVLPASEDEVPLHPHATVR
jgi:cell division protein FtsB